MRCRCRYGPRRSATPAPSAPAATPPAALAHLGKMLPAIAATAITRYTAPGDLVADPMCGIGTTLIEAVHLGRDGIGVERVRRRRTGPGTAVRRATSDEQPGERCRVLRPHGVLDPLVVLDRPLREYQLVR